MNIKFNEPVVVDDITQFTMYEGLPLISTFNYTFDTVVNVEASGEDPKVMVATLENRCRGGLHIPLSSCEGEGGNLFSVLASPQAILYLTATPAAAFDRAQARALHFSN